MHFPPRSAQRGSDAAEPRLLDLGPRPETGQRRERLRPDRRQEADCPPRQRRAVLCPPHARWDGREISLSCKSAYISIRPPAPADDQSDLQAPVGSATVENAREP